MGYLSDIPPQGTADQLLQLQALSSLFCWKDTRWHSQAFTPLGSFYRSCLKVFKQNLCRTPFWFWCGVGDLGCDTVSELRAELSAGSESISVFHNTGESLESSWDSATYNSAPHKSQGEAEGLQEKQQEKCSHSVSSFGSKRMYKNWH